MSIINAKHLRTIAEVEYSDIVADVWIPGLNTLRILLQDGSFVDVWYSLKLESRYSYHWEKRALDGTIYRHDNAPHRRWQDVSTWPKHFHDGSETDVTESHISSDAEAGLREFLDFVRAKLGQERGVPQGRDR